VQRVLVPQVEPHEKPAAGQIRDSNRVMLMAAVRRAGGVAVDGGKVVDNKVCVLVGIACLLHWRSWSGALRLEHQF
jgi:hypothetical protein